MNQVKRTAAQKLTAEARTTASLFQDAFCRVLEVVKRKDGYHLIVEYGDEGMTSYAMGANAKLAKKHLRGDFCRELSERDTAFSTAHPIDTSAIVSKLFEPGGILA